MSFVISSYLYVITFGSPHLGLVGVRGTATCVPGKWFSPLSKLEVVETDYQHDIWDYIVAGGQRSRITEISYPEVVITMFLDRSGEHALLI